MLCSELHIHEEASVPCRVGPAMGAVQEAMLLLLLLGHMQRSKPAFAAADETVAGLH